MPDPVFGSDMAEAYAGADVSYPLFRTLAYVVPCSGDSLLAFYRTIWPDLPFSPLATGSERSRAWSALLLSDGRTLRPQPRDEVDKPDEQKAPVIGLLVNETASPAPEILARHRLPEGRPYCSLLVDYRANPPER